MMVTGLRMAHAREGWNLQYHPDLETKGTKWHLTERGSRGPKPYVTAEETEPGKVNVAVKEGCLADLPFLIPDYFQGKRRDGPPLGVTGLLRDEVLAVLLGTGHDI